MIKLHLAVPLYHMFAIMLLWFVRKFLSEILKKESKSFVQSCFSKTFPSETFDLNETLCKAINSDMKRTLALNQYTFDNEL